MKMIAKTGLAASVLLIGAAAVYLTTGNNAYNKIPYTDAQAVQAGEQIYLNACASCHGKALQGQPNWQTRDANGYLPAPPHDKTGHTWHHDDALLFKITKEGVQSIAGADYKTYMPAFGSTLTDEEIWSVLAYIKAQWPKPLAQQHTNRFKNK